MRPLVSARASLPGVCESDEQCVLLPVNANFCKDDSLESRTKAAFLTYFKARCTVDDHHIKATTFTVLFTDVQHTALGV